MTLTRQEITTSLFALCNSGKEPLAFPHSIIPLSDTETGSLDEAEWADYAFNPLSTELLDAYDESRLVGVTDDRSVVMAKPTWVQLVEAVIDEMRPEKLAALNANCKGRIHKVYDVETVEQELFIRLKELESSADIVKSTKRESLKSRHSVIKAFITTTSSKELLEAFNPVDDVHWDLTQSWSAPDASNN